MPKCIFLVGMPAAGKSTWCTKNLTLDAARLSTDDIVEQIAKQYGYTYNEVWKNAVGLAEQLMFRSMDTLAKMGKDIVLDRTNLTVKSRARIMEILKPHGYTFEAVEFETPPQDEWKRRLENRPGKNIPWDVLVDMAKRYEPVKMTEGFTKIEYV